MALNYARRLERLQERKFDRELRESIFEKSAYARLLPQDVKYLVEAMLPIEQKYNERTLEAATRVQNHLENGMKFTLRRVYRTQGSVMTGTNIKVHSDFDLLAVIDRYHFPEVHKPENEYTETVPADDIFTLREEATRVMKQTYDEVDDSGPKSICIFNKALNRKVDIVFCFWYLTVKYEQTKDDFYRGIDLYNFPQKQKVPPDYPFATIHHVNTKGDVTKDGSRRGIRLLKTLRADSDVELKVLKSFHLTSIVHSIDSERLVFVPGREIHIAKAVSERFEHLIEDPEQRQQLKSPNGLETPLADDKTVAEMQMLKRDLDEIMADSQKELRSLLVENAVRNY